MTYMSVDLDYFREGHSPTAFMRRVFALGVEMLVVAQHDQLLDHVNQSCCRTLVNVDAHSDIVDDPCDFNEGTWVNHVSWRAEGTYEWRHPPGYDVHGYCHARVNPFREPCSGWQSVRRKQGLAGIPWSEISHVGICLSSRWLDEARVQPIVERLGVSKWLKMSYAEQRIHCQPFLYG